jgi:DUF971 family protein
MPPENWFASIFVPPINRINEGSRFPAEFRGLNPLMRPLDLQTIGGELAIKWDDGGESFIPLETLRRACPCAGCKGEMDVMGNVYKLPSQPLSPKAFELRQIAWVGGYGIQPVWADGHSTGIYSFNYLRQLAETAK